jgi:hypothetical protein
MHDLNLFNILKIREAAISRGLVPFLTEFGSQDWDDLCTDIEPRDNIRQNK